jgi:hypothetical protein
MQGEGMTHKVERNVVFEEIIHEFVLANLILCLIYPEDAFMYSTRSLTNKEQLVL